ncbi:MAG: GNAT family N-acetyltransferase [Saprospiraceae bacterium]|nr:GNAT family N-acetyltransferase [Saprospiraceae bacterium]
MQTHFAPYPNLYTDRLELRPFQDLDAPEIFLQRSDERILQHISIQKAETLEDALAFIHLIEKNMENGEGMNWAICLKDETKLIGTICLWNFQPEKSIAELGYSLHPDHWGKGYASEALAAVVDFGFEKIGAAILEAYVQTANIASVKLLEKAGFVKTGVEEIYSVYALCRPPLGAVIMETERLRLREIIPGDDAPYLLELLNTPDWLANIGDRNVRNLDDARKYAIYRIWLNCRLKGFSFYVLERKTDSAKLGMCGLIKRDYLDDVDIGYALLPQFYGQGYVVEAAAAVLNFGKQDLKLPRLEAITIESNKPSQRVLEKVGLRFERIITVPGDGEELMLLGVALGTKLIVIIHEFS